MKIKYILPFIFLLLSFYSKSVIANDITEASSSKLLIGVNDTIVVDLKNAVKTIFSSDSSYIDIPLYVKSTQPITALDIQFQFNQSKLTYFIINDAIPGYLSSISNYRSTTDQYLVYGAYIANVSSTITPNITLAYYRFKFKTSCYFQLNSSDFYGPLALLNGVICSYKFTTLDATNIPTAQFSNGALCSNSNVQFTDLSSTTGGIITAWDWDLGNGQSSNAQNPTSTYSVSGTYTASLIVTESTGCIDTIIKQLIIESPPISSFSYTLDCVKDSVYFTNLSSIANGTISNYIWDFGDLGTSGFVNPSHHYNSGGTYTVSLTSTSTASCINSSTLAVVLDKPIANFVVSSSNNCIGSTLSFSNTSTYATGLITSWNWDFGDGNTSSVQNPSYTYTTAGIYTVTLVSSSANGCSGSATQTINVNSNPTVQFSGDVLSGCSTQTVNFFDASTPTIGSQYTWSFGDGGISSNENPTHIYSNAGTYSVKLTVTTANGCIDSLIKLSYISIYNSPVSNFLVSSGCVNSVVSFTDNSIGTVTSWDWSFGDGITSNTQNPSHTFTNSGVYTVTLSVLNSDGCNSVVTKSVTINNKPLVQFTADSLVGCTPAIINFTNLSNGSAGSSSIWYFGDNSISNLQNPSHSYTIAGTYNVKLVVSEPGGCSDSLEKINYISILNSPIALFTVSNNTLTLPNAVFSCTNSSINYTNVEWTFGDNQNSNENNPSHNYTDIGVYEVCITAYNSNACSNKFCDDIYVKALDIVAVPSAFTPNSDNINDVLKVKGGPFQEMEFRILNEWGNLLFSSSSQNDGWDGKFKGDNQPSGIYEYTLKGTTIENKIINLYGVVKLIR